MLDVVPPSRVVGSHTEKDCEKQESVFVRSPF